MLMLDFFQLFVKLECPDFPYLKMLSRVIPDKSFFPLMLLNKQKNTSPGEMKLAI